MKFSTIVAALAVALSLTGCKYDKMNEGKFDENEFDQTAITDINSDVDETTAQGGNVTDISTRYFDEYLPRCTDVSFTPVYFGFDTSVIASGETYKIDEVVSHLQSNPKRVAIIEGNCDERGSNEYNLTLGEHRATCIRDYMVKSGISSDRLQTRSYGSEKPAVAGHDESAWKMNRRGEFAIFQK